MKELEQLRDLLLGREFGDLEQLQARTEDRARLVRDVAEVLPEAILAGNQDGGRVADALLDSLGDPIRRSIERDRRGFAEALVPVMGLAVRERWAMRSGLLSASSIKRSRTPFPRAR